MSDFWQTIRNSIKGSEITLTLTVTAAYLVYRWLQPRSNDAKQKLHNNAKQKLHSTPPEPLKKNHVYDKAELAKFNGTTDGRAVLVAVSGKVFDVTAGKDFYGPGGPYAAFAGVDASRMLAKMQTSPDDKDPSIADLTSSEKTSLESWSQFFDGKYPVVGTYT